MSITTILKHKNMSIYKLSKESQIPYATLSDICNGKTNIARCSAETVYRIAKALDITMEYLIEPSLIDRSSFENFKSSICHRLKDMGDLVFIENTLESGEIRMYCEREWYPECLYLLAMLDYISRINNIPLCDEYDDIRQYKLAKPVYPAGIRAVSAVRRSNEPMEEAIEDSIPEFRRFNIIENEVRSVV